MTEPSEPGARDDPPAKSSSPPPPSVLKVLGSRAEAPRVVLRDTESDSGKPTRAPAASSGDLPNTPDPRFRVIEEIARGGMGVVVRGHDEDLGRDVAMKFLRPDHEDNPAILHRFIEEAQIGGQLQHPGVVPVYQLGLDDRDHPYFAMKLVKGQTLAQLLGERKDPSEDRGRFLSIFEKICQTVAYAHSRGVIHRDLKPANVMVGAFGEVQVVDWGLAKVLGRESAQTEAADQHLQHTMIETVRSRPDSTGSKSMAGSILGTPNYMPPEQARGDIHNIDERSDVFALGAILCEILTGTPVYGALDDPLVAAVEADQRAALERLENCSAEEGLVQLCRRCLSPAPAARLRNAKELAEQISTYLVSAEERALQAQVKAADERRRRNVTMAFAGSALLILLIVGGGVFWVQRDRQERIERTVAAVTKELEQASLWYGEARTGNVEDLSAWESAISSSEQARSLMDAGEVDDATRERVESLNAELDRGFRAAKIRAESVARDQELLRALEQVQLEASADQSQFDRSYRELFADYGLPVDEMELDEACAEIAESAIAVELAFALDEWAQARRILDFTRANEPDSISYRDLITIAQAADPDEVRGQVRDAFRSQDPARLRALRDSIELTELPAATIDLLGNGLHFANDTLGAIQTYRMGQAIHPDSYRTHVRLALTILRTGRGSLEVAGEALRAALAVRPYSVTARQGMVLLASAREDVDEWEYWCGELLRVRPDHADSFYQFGLLETHRRDHEVAREYYEEAVMRAPESVDYHMSLARTLLALDEVDDAASSYREVLDLNPLELQARVDLALMLLEADRIEESIEVMEEGVEIEPRAQGFHLVLAMGYREQKSYEDAIDHFRIALRLAVTNEALQGLFFALWESGRPDEAAEEVRILLRRYPDDTGLTVGLGQVHYFRGQYQEAREALEKARERFPNEGSMLLWLVRIMTITGSPYLDEIAQAEEYAREAIRVAPNSMHSFEALGWALYRAGDYDAAHRAFEESSRLTPAPDREPPWCLFRAMNHWQRGETDKAMEWFERGENLAPTVAALFTPLDEEYQRLRAEAVELMGLE